MKHPLMAVSSVFLLCFAFACQDKAAMAELEKYRSQAKLEEQNKALVMRYLDTWVKGDVAGIKEIFSPDYVWHSELGQTASLEQTIKQLEGQKAAFSDRTISTEELIAKGDRVVHRYIARGTHTGNKEGLPATGNKLEVGGIEIIRIENGKIAENWEVLNWLSWYKALGFELKQKEVKK